MCIDLFVLQQGYTEPLLCWDPQCIKKFGWNYEEIENMSDDYLSNSTLSSLSRVVSVRENIKKKNPIHYIPGQYKYVVVPDGMMSVSTSSRLLHVLGHCECVVLLVNSVLQFHFSGKLIPWVHYVPLSTSGADLVAKVRYLVENDHIAQQIAKNGNNNYYDVEISFLLIELLVFIFYYFYIIICYSVLIIDYFYYFHDFIYIFILISYY